MRRPVCSYLIHKENPVVIKEKDIFSVSKGVGPP